jgi:hypothetical protein
MGRYDDDDYTPSGADEAPTESEGSAPTITKEARKVVRGGWGNAQKQKAASSPFPQRLSPDKDGVVVKFLEDGPYASYRQHWINEIQQGTKAFTCIDGMGTGSCPLCDGGNRASSQFMFNVAELSEDGPAELKTYNVGITVFDQLSDHHTDPRQGPLEKHYWVIKRSKNGNKWTTTLFMQREDELAEQGYQIPSEIELAAMKLWDDNEVRITPRKELVEVAAQYLDLE